MIWMHIYPFAISSGFILALFLVIPVQRTSLPPFGQKWSRTSSRENHPIFSRYHVRFSARGDIIAVFVGVLTGVMSLLTVLTIAGSQHGIPPSSRGFLVPLADLKTFTALNCCGTSVITALTTRNTTGVCGAHACPSEFLKDQASL